VAVDATSSSRDDRALATRAALVDAARSLFGDQGYADTSVQAIVEDAAVTKGAFYHHFEHKQELFLHVFEEVQHEIGRRAFVVHVEHEHDPSGAGGRRFRDLSAESDEEVWAHVLEGCRTYLELHTDPHVQRIVLIDGRAVLPWSQWHRVQSEHGVTLLRADLRRAQGRGLIPDLPLRALSTMLAGALHEACMTIAHADDGPAALEDAMAVVACFLSGLRSD
jgi:AcrR family transcriptional regulator